MKTSFNQASDILSRVWFFFLLVLCHQKILGSSEPERQARGRLSPRLALRLGNARPKIWAVT